MRQDRIVPPVDRAAVAVRQVRSALGGRQQDRRGQSTCRSRLPGRPHAQQCPRRFRAGDRVRADRDAQASHSDACKRSGAAVLRLYRPRRERRGSPARLVRQDDGLVRARPPRWPRSRRRLRTLLRGPHPDPATGLRHLPQPRRRHDRVRARGGRAGPATLPHAMDQREPPDVLDACRH